MPRKPRAETPGGTFHVYARGNDRQLLFRDATDRRRYLSLLGRSVSRRRWALLAYCLMPNHVHLLVRTPEPNLAAGMQCVHSPYAQAFNRRHGRTGHVFEGRYGAVPVKTDAYFITVVRYIAQNPVAAGLVTLPGDWPWSSYRAAAGQDAPPPWLDVGHLYELLGVTERNPQKSYVRVAAT